MKSKATQPDSTAERVALWRAMHIQVDPQPHIFVDEVGLRLIRPKDGWRDRPDMHPLGTSRFRASIVARARYIEDFVIEQSKKGINQYVLLGAGIDTFSQRRPEFASQFQIFEVDKPDFQEWKRQRLVEEGLGVPNWLHLVPVDFEKNERWWDRLVDAGFDAKKPAIVTSIGVSMYLTIGAIKDMLRISTRLAQGSKFIMTFMLPLELVDAEDKAGYEMALKGAQKSGTPFISFFHPEEMLKIAREAGFKKAEHLAIVGLTPRYFASRTDGLKPSSGEELLIASM